MENTFFRVHSGLMTPEHHKRIGKALWVFLWIIDRTTDESKDGLGSGAVLYGNPVPYRIIHDELGIPIPTIKAHCDALKKEGYITVKSTPRGNIIHVMKSKKWDKSYSDHSKNGMNRSENETKHSENGTHDNEDRSENETKHSKNGTEHSKNDPSILKDNINNNLKDKEIKEKEQKEKAAASDSLSYESLKQEILNEFVRLRGVGFHTSPADSTAADEIVQSGISLSDATQYMQECFNQYQPKHKRDRINTLSYCVGYVLDRHHQESSDAGQASIDLANEFLTGLKNMVPDISEPNIKAWAADMQKLLDKGKSIERIKEIMNFARNDSFWSGHVLSPVDLTRKFDKLAVQASAKAQPKKSNERKDKLPKWVEEDKQEGTQTGAIKENNHQEATQEFNDMLAQLRAQKQGRKTV
ncbi:hypothetical protein MKX54_11130 [Alkalihalobacillus sp. FSL R5-0424]